MLPLTVYFVFVFAVVLKATNGSPLNDSVLIVGGEEVDITDYPYQVQLLLDGTHLCGGSIISPEFILTAAHCVSDRNIGRLSVKVGSSYAGYGGQIYSLSKKFVHPKYIGGSYDYDVAVLKTSVKMSIDGVTTSIVQMAYTMSILIEGLNIVVTGWGRTEEGGPISDVLRAVTVPVVSLDYCKGAYQVIGFQVTNNMICAGSDLGSKDACQSDSGSPAVLYEDSFVQYGIVSTGAGCASKNFPGIYTSIPAVRYWIYKVTGI